MTTTHIAIVDKVRIGVSSNVFLLTIPFDHID